MRKEALKIEQDDYSPQELFLESQTTCCLCGHELEFYHQMDFQNQKVTEEALCTGCHIKSKSHQHNLH